MPNTLDHEHLNKNVTDYKQLNDENLMFIFADTNDVNNQRAFETLYQRHKGPLYRFIKKSMNNSQDANELFQELWFKIIKYKNNFNSNQKFTTWAYTIAKRLLIDQFRKFANSTSNSSKTSEIDANETSDLALKQPENEFTAKRMSKQLHTAVLSLPIEQRQTFVMHHDSGLSLQEISKISNQNYEKTKSQYRYAIKKLKLALERFK